MNIEWKTDSQMMNIISTRTPRGLFVCLDDLGTTAIDNSTGDAWTEDFVSITAAEAWLRKNDRN